MRAEGPLTAPPTLVVGVGNRGRGDDAIGPLVVDALNKAWHDMYETGEYETRVAEGDLSHLVLEWGPNQDVIVVDAMVSHRDPGTVVETDALDRTLLPSPSLLSSHGVGLAETVELARMLNRLPRSLNVIAIEGSSFEQFAPLSEPVAAAIPRVVEELSQLLELQPDPTKAAHDPGGPDRD